MTDKNTEQKIQQLQIIEQSLQNFLGQKQQFQAHVVEIESALEELKSQKTAYKIIGNVMVETDAEKLKTSGVAAIDVSGVGGTTFAAVEHYRIKNQNGFYQNLGDLFWDWGIPTAISIIEVCNTVSIPIIASGGIRNGIDIAKALALGSSQTSLSLPILQKAVKGLEETKTSILSLINELRTVMFLIGVEKIPDLNNKSFIVTGKTAQWLSQRGFYSNFNRKF